MIEMQFLVIAEARDTIVGDDVRRLRKDAATAIQRLQASGKLQAGGVLAGRRRPFLLLEVDSCEELMELLGSEMIDSFNCDVHPVVSFDALKRFFQEHPV